VEFVAVKSADGTFTFAATSTPRRQHRALAAAAPDTLAKTDRRVRPVKSKQQRQQLVGDVPKATQRRRCVRGSALYLAVAAVLGAVA
jgi:hypothetical protein